MLRPSSTLWQLLPKLRFVQFPWRWMSILTIPLVYFLAAAFSGRRLRWLWAVAAAAVYTGTAVFLVQHTWWDDEEFPTLRASIASGEGFDGTDEYDPIGDDHYNLPPKAPLAQLLPSDEGRRGQAASPQVIVERWTPERKIVLVVQSPQATRLALRLLNYPAWRVEVNGSKIEAERAEDYGQMVIPLPPGTALVTARFTRTPDRSIGGILSILSALAAFSIRLWHRAKRPQ
jgi:hypothetical protein